MKKIKIITDSTSYITKEYARENRISIVPLNYTFNEITKKEGFPGEFDEFFNELSSSKLFPTTSQPAVGDFIAEFEKAFSEGYDEIIAILLSSKLSGTYNSGVLAKNMLEDERITIIDSLQAASNLRFLVADALSMVEEGKDRKEIVNYIERKKSSMNIYFTVDTLEYLRRGGRLTSIEAAIGSVLNIKPIIELKEGELKLLERVRGKNKAVKGIIDKVYEEVKKISVCHVLNEEEALKMMKGLKDRFPKAVISIDEVGPVIGCHLGPKGMGICFY
jgi:DegV family protein with EDD domain